MMDSLWKDGCGDELPEYDREVIAFVDRKVVIAHRPDPRGWYGTNISTGETKHYQPKTYDKGGWNMPGVVKWLDYDLPPDIE